MAILGMVMRSFSLMAKHFATLTLLPSVQGGQLKSRCLSFFWLRRAYLLPPVPTLSYFMDPRYSLEQYHPSAEEVAATVDLC